MNILINEKFGTELEDFGFAVEITRVSCGCTMFTANFVCLVRRILCPRNSQLEITTIEAMYTFMEL